MKFCPYCGELLPTPNIKFCPECGQKLMPQQPAEGGEQDNALTPRVTPEELWEQAIRQPEELPVQAPLAQRVYQDDSFAEEPYDEAAAQAFEQGTFEDEYEELPPRHEPEPVKATKNKRARPAKQPKEKRQRSGAGKIWIIILCVVLLLTGVAGVFVLKINAKKAPQRAVETFISAVSANDIQYVLEHLETAGSGLSSAEDVKKMCEALRNQADLKALGNHLLAGGDEWAHGSSKAYDSFTLKQTKNTLFSQKFVVKLSPVQLLIQTTAPDVTFYVDDKTVQAEQAEGGLLLKLAPGAHTVRAVYAQYGPEYELGKTEVLSFSASEQQTVAVGQNMAALELELAGTETNLQVLVNGAKTELAPQGGFVVLSPVFKDMEVTIKCDQYTQTFKAEGKGDAQYTVDYVKEQETKNPNPKTPAEMTNRQLLNQLAPRFYSFYTSYLEAINKWDKKLIKYVDSAYSEELVNKMEAYNKDLLFDFHGIKFDRRSIARTEKGGELYATFNLQADYNYTYKKDNSKWFAGGNYQIVTMHYNTAAKQWEVCGTVIKEELQLSTDTFEIKP